MTMTTTEQRIADDTAANQQDATNLYALALEVGKILGWYVDEQNSMGIDSVVWLKNDAYPHAFIRLAVPYRVQGQQLQISSGIRGTSGIADFYPNSGYTCRVEIGCSVTKRPVLVAGDITRRVLPDFLSTYTIIDTLYKERMAQHDAALAHAESLIAKSQGTMRRTPDGNGQYEKEWVSVIALETVGAGVLSCDFQVYSDGKVHIDCRSTMTNAFANDFIELLANKGK